MSEQPSVTTQIFEHGVAVYEDGELAVFVRRMASEDGVLPSYEDVLAAALKEYENK